jgi:hypothetical protein
MSSKPHRTFFVREGCLRALSFSPQVVFLGLLFLVSLPLSMIAQAPVITVQPQGTNVNPGATVTLSVTASGPGPFRYQWRQNGENIPGETSSTLTYANVLPTLGGTYSVVVFNNFGAVKSAPAVVLINAPALALSDNLSGRITLSSSSETRLGSNVGATKEAGEPDHAGKEGGHSVWMGWRAPANGTITFHTHGSSFDTLLAAYRGSSVVNLSLVAANDDHGPGVGNARRGPGFTSQITFNVTNGVEYLIAVDGRAEATGNIVLSWIFVPGAPDFPEITYQPEDQPIQTNGIATFYVGDSGGSYQWYSNAIIKVGATLSGINATPTPGELGFYTVQVTRNGRTVESDPAVLEIVTHSATATKDKLQDILEQGGVSISLPTHAPTNRGPKFVSLAAGAVGYQILNNKGSTSDPDEPIHAGVGGGASRWQAIEPQNDGVLLLDTAGSDPDTVLAVYTGTSVLNLQLVAEDDNSGPDGKSAQVQFHVTAGTRYLVTVDTVGGVTGVIHLNWRLGDFPFVSQPSLKVFNPGEYFTLNPTISGGVGPYTYQWSKNGQNLGGETNPTLAINNAQIANEGNYTLTVSTIVGPVTSTIRLVQIRDTPFFDAQPQNALLAQGTPHTLTAHAIATLPARYQWQFKGKSIKGATNGNYVLPGLLVKNSGPYRVIATTDAGSATSTLAYVTFLIPPLVATPPKSVVVGNSRKATFKVRAKGSPPLQYQWQLNGVDIPNATGPSYTIPNVSSPGQLGQYRVSIANALQYIFSDPAQLFGVAIKRQPRDGIVAVGKKFTFKVKATGPGPLIYQWRRNGIAIPGANAATFIIPQAPPDAGGIYSVDVGSPLATITSSTAILTVTGAMEAVHNESPSVPRLSVEIFGAGVKIILRGVPETAYLLEASDDLIQWKMLGELTPGPNGEISFIDNSSRPHRFYRATPK